MNWNSFVAFNVNAANNFMYMLTSNFWFIFLLIAVVGTVILQLKDQVDHEVRKEQNII